MSENLTNSLKGDNPGSDPSRERNRVSLYFVWYEVGDDSVGSLTNTSIECLVMFLTGRSRGFRSTEANVSRVRYAQAGLPSYLPPTIAP